MNKSQLDELQQQARAQGMMLVDSSKTDDLFEEYDKALKEADRLADIIDPENKPFDSKYKARDILEEMGKKFEANKAIAMLDNNTSLVAKLRVKLANLRTKLGLLCWDCEEPQNAQTELEEACNFFFPGLIEKIEKLGGENADPTPFKDSASNLVDYSAMLSSIPPHVSDFDNSYLVEGMRCLNILGILWSGRGQPSKAVLYLLTAQQLYESHSLNTPPPPPPSKLSNATNITTSNISNDPLEHCYTHNLFYLAQAYGHLQDPQHSSLYCHKTLQRQLATGLSDIKSMLDWVKNCAGLGDYYLALGLHGSAMALYYSAEKIFKDQVIKVLYEKYDEQLRSMKEEQGDSLNIESMLEKKKPNFVQGNLNAAEIEAELHRRLAILDVRILKKGMDYAKLGSTEALDDDERDRENLQSFRVEGESSVSVFTGLLVSKPSYVFIEELSSFEKARVVFLRAAARIESAKKYFVLDGYVTDHVGLLQEYSKLYHYLSAFEPEIKRRIAMESRRTELLLPLLKSLNKSSYEVLHKQIAYEMGETALALIDLKLDKLRYRDDNTLQEVTEKSFKKNDIAKYNEYCKIGLACFSHFIYMYAHNADRALEHGFAHLETLPLHTLAAKFLDNADESQITEEEVRPFLNAHFLSCRIMQKTLSHPSTLPPTSSNASQRAYYLIQCLKRYEHIGKIAGRLCEKRQMTVEDVFGEEMKIITEMISLLPSKIDRVCYRGETGLTL